MSMKSKAKAKARPKAISKKIQPRRRVQPLWKSRWALAVGMVLLMAGIVGGSYQLWRSGWVVETAGKIYDKGISVTADVGFRVDEILVIGREQSNKKAIMKALGLQRGSTILDFSPQAAKERIEKLAWVRSASVERLLPGTILLNVTERKPMALWQNQGRFHVIDKEGKVIIDKGVERFADLFVVVGEGAKEKAVELMTLLETEPEIQILVKAAVRVGKRRWNLHLSNDVDVRLPEENPESAWLRLADYHRDHGLLGGDVQVLDLRLPDRLIIKTSGQKDRIQKVSGKVLGHRT